jgi:hypothetical protein
MLYISASKSPRMSAPSGQGEGIVAGEGLPRQKGELGGDWQVRTCREGGNALGPDLYYEMRYESLVSKPAEECKKLCEFLGISYDEAMLCFNEGRERPKPGRSAKRAWLRVTPGLRDWRSGMSAEDVERFEAAAGDLLNELDKCTR